MTKLLIVLTMLLVLTNCTPKKDDAFDRITTYRVESVSDDFFEWDRYVQSVIPIPLETNSNSVIGHIAKGDVNSDGIYLHDFINHVLLHFDIEGKFLQKIGHKGRGPNEYLEVRDFCIVNNAIYTLDYRKIATFNKKSGAFIDSWKIDSNSGLNPLNFHVFDRNNYYLWDSNSSIPRGSIQSYYHLHKVVDNKIDKHYFKYSQGSTYTSRFYKSSGQAYNITPTDYSYTIHKLTTDSVFPSFKIDFGKKALTFDQAKALKKNIDKNAFLKSNFFKNISCVLELDDYIYFKCVGPKSKVYEAVVEKATGKVDLGRWNYKLSPMILCTDGKALYGYYSPNKLLNYEAIGGSGNSCFAPIKKSCTDVTVEDNPVLVKIVMR